MDHSASARRFFERINSGDFDQVVEMLAPDFVEHEEIPGIPPGREGVRQLFSMFQTAFPDIHWELLDVFAGGDRVAIRARVTGTNHGELMGMPATGKSVSVPLIDILRFDEDGLIREHWGVFDMMSMMQQLGPIPHSPT